MGLQSMFGNLRKYEESKGQRKQSLRDMKEHHKDMLATLISKNKCVIGDSTSENDSVNDIGDEDLKQFSDLASQDSLIVKQFKNFNNARKFKFGQRNVDAGSKKFDTIRFKNIQKV